MWKGKSTLVLGSGESALSQLETYVSSTVVGDNPVLLAISLTWPWAPGPGPIHYHYLGKYLKCNKFIVNVSLMKF